MACGSMFVNISMISNYQKVVKIPFEYVKLMFDRVVHN